VYDVVVKKFTFAISSFEEFLVISCICHVCIYRELS